ncbi:hypothetical protein DL96DRAFT_1822502 [Flagelloscypha sp. PMI_526]|nr:hypothetical protein DL96DRAFT_1822502 [Flagelloscypha sp. PMI_526]
MMGDGFFGLSCFLSLSFPLMTVVLFGFPIFYLFIFSALARTTYIDHTAGVWTFTKSAQTAPWCEAPGQGTACLGNGLPPHGGDGRTLDISETYQGTYHSGLAPSVSRLQFQGTSISVYGVRINASCALTCSIEGQSQQTAYPGSPPGAELAYNEPLCNITGLDGNINSTLVLSLRYIKYGNGSLGGNTMIFDYAVVTASDPETSSTASVLTSETKASTIHATPAGSIAGGVIGGIAFALTVLLLLLWRRRRGQNGQVAASHTFSGTAPRYFWTIFDAESRILQMHRTPRPRFCLSITFNVLLSHAPHNSLFSTAHKKEASQSFALSNLSNPESSGSTPITMSKIAQLEQEIAILRDNANLPPSYR